MTEQQLLEAVARLWVDNGGDVDGVDFCLQKLKDAIKQEIENREDTL